MNVTDEMTIRDIMVNPTQEQELLVEYIKEQRMFIDDIKSIIDLSKKYHTDMTSHSDSLTACEDVTYIRMVLKNVRPYVQRISDEWKANNEYDTPTEDDGVYYLAYKINELEHDDLCYANDALTVAINMMKRYDAVGEMLFEEWVN